jgi:hypothetical protein
MTSTLQEYGGQYRLTIPKNIVHLGGYKKGKNSILPKYKVILH